MKNEKISKIKEVLEYLEITYDIRDEDDDFIMFFDEDEGIFNVIIDNDAVILQFDVFMLPSRAAILTETFINHGLIPDFYDKSYIDTEGELFLGEDADDKRNNIIKQGESQLCLEKKSADVICLNGGKDSG